MRRRSHDHSDERHVHDEGTIGLGLFSAQQVQWPAPVAPGSATSTIAGEELDASGTRQREVMRVLGWFAKQSMPRTRNELAAALYAGHLGSACGRVADCVTLGWIAEVGRVGKRATLAITAKGRAQMQGHRRSA